MPDPNTALQQWPIVAVIIICIGLAAVGYAAGWSWLNKQISVASASWSDRLAEAEKRIAELEREVEAEKNGKKSARIHYFEAFRHIDKGHAAYPEMLKLGEALA